MTMADSYWGFEAGTMVPRAKADVGACVNLFFQEFYHAWVNAKSAIAALFFD